MVLLSNLSLSDQTIALTFPTICYKTMLRMLLITIHQLQQTDFDSESRNKHSKNQAGLLNNKFGV